MYYPSRVYVLQSAQDLVNQKLHVIVGQLLRAYYVVQVGTHEIGDEVDLAGVIVRVEHILQSDHILVTHVLQQLQLSVGPFGVDS